MARKAATAQPNAVARSKNAYRRQAGPKTRQHVICGARQSHYAMHMRRFKWLTNGFSKKIENHAHQVALHFMYYNFVPIHSALRMTPAMAAGVSDRLWEIGDIVALSEANDPKPVRRVLILKTEISK
jgi:hypothetical protein